MQDNPERKRLNGVVYTPTEVADEVAKVGVSFCSGKTLRILEPSAGDGAFLRALVSIGIEEVNITAVDIDNKAVCQLRGRYRNATIIESEFLEYVLRRSGDEFDLVIGNPPFIKRVGYSVAFKDRLDKLSQLTGFPLAELKNSWAAFVVGAMRLIGPNGVIALVLPYELITVKYGRRIQEYLVRQGFVVDIIVSEEKAFSSIDQDAVIMLAKRAKEGDEELRINKVMKLSQIEPIRSSTVDKFNSEKAAIDLKSVLFDAETASLLKKLRSELKTIKDYCDSSAGIVTAANDYFILRPSDTERLRLKPWARRILKKGSYLPNSPIFRDEDISKISASEPCELIDFHWLFAPTLSEAARTYIEQGEEMELHKRYKCRYRKPWYRIPIVPASQGLFFKRAYIFPRLCINKAHVLATDAAYQITVKDGHNIQDVCFSFYNSITLLFAEIDGRFYGGGVLELTPSEFRGLPLYFMRTTNEEFESFERTFPSSRVKETGYFANCDQRICHELKLTYEEMVKIQKALQNVREHRLRHG